MVESRERRGRWGLGVVAGGVGSHAKGAKVAKGRWGASAGGSPLGERSKTKVLLPVNSGDFRSFPVSFEKNLWNRFETVPKLSQRFPEIPRDSQGFPRFPKVSQHF